MLQDIISNPTVKWAIYLGLVYAFNILPFQFIIWRHRKNEKSDSVNSGAKFG